MAKGKYEKWLKPENLILIQGWRRDGLSDGQVAHNMGISRATLHQWLKDHSAIFDAYKKGEAVSSYEVENALYKSATGYDVTETEQEETTFPDGTVVTKKRARKRHIPPSVGAICFILKNRLPDKWRDRQVIEQQSDGLLAQLIDGLKEPDEVENDLHEETTTADAPVADQQAETN